MKFTTSTFSDVLIANMHTPQSFLIQGQGGSSAVQRLPSKHESLTLIPRTQKEKKKINSAIKLNFAQSINQINHSS